VEQVVEDAKKRRHGRQAFVIAAVLGLLVALVTSCGEQEQTTDQTTPGFAQPAIRRSAQGTLRTTLHTRIAPNTLVDQFSGETRHVRTPTYDGTIPGPTLVVNPGDTLSIELVNDLPSNPKGQRGGFFPQDQYTINLHTHGLTVSPLGISDNILRRMEPGTTNQVEVHIPRDHPSGTYWYHPHVHGTVTFQFFAGRPGC